MRDDEQDMVYQKGLRIAEEINNESQSQGRRRRPNKAASKEENATGAAAAGATTSPTTNEALGLCQSVLYADNHCVPSEEECLGIPPHRQQQCGSSVAVAVRDPVKPRLLTLAEDPSSRRCPVKPRLLTLAEGSSSWRGPVTLRLLTVADMDPSGSALGRSPNEFLCSCSTLKPSLTVTPLPR